MQTFLIGVSLDDLAKIFNQPGIPANIALKELSGRTKDSSSVARSLGAVFASFLSRSMP